MLKELLKFVVDEIDKKDPCDLGGYFKRFQGAASDLIGHLEWLESTKNLDEMENSHDHDL